MSRALRTVLDEANPNKTDGAAHDARLGSFLARVSRTIRATVVANKIVLPDNAKAERVLAAFVTAGTVSGWFNPTNVVPATTKDASTDGSGNIFFLAADAVTEAEVTYLPFEGDVVEETVPVVTNVATPSGSRKAMCLLAATGTVGTTLGAKTIDPRATAPAAAHAAINLLDTGVAFNAGDALTMATIRYIATPGQGTAKAALGVNLDAVTSAY